MIVIGGLGDILLLWQEYGLTPTLTLESDLAVHWLLSLEDGEALAERSLLRVAYSPPPQHMVPKGRSSLQEPFVYEDARS